MLAKLIGIVFIVIGGYIAFTVIFPLIGSLLESILNLIGLAIAVVCIGIGYRLLKRD
ncbi:MAG: hypothetical protein OXG87_02320 [Gemmatimonadetes bacterium]|nr:hypothetical protein [Gemmatimonadota bacterium]